MSRTILYAAIFVIAVGLAFYLGTRFETASRVSHTSTRLAEVPSLLDPEKRLLMHNACAEAAERFYKDNSIELPGTISNFESHFNAKLQRCIVKITTSSNSSATATLTDPSDGTNFGSATFPTGQAPYCLKRTDGKTEVLCSASEWDRYEREVMAE